MLLCVSRLRIKRNLKNVQFLNTPWCHCSRIWMHGVQNCACYFHCTIPLFACLHAQPTTHHLPDLRYLYILLELVHCFLSEKFKSFFSSFQFLFGKKCRIRYTERFFPEKEMQNLATETNVTLVSSTAGNRASFLQHNTISEYIVFALHMRIM